MRRLNDGHSVYINMCYDQTYTTYLPIPLVLLVDESGHQDVYIAPEAFSVTQKNFPEQIDTWQNALDGDLKGKLESVCGENFAYMRPISDLLSPSFQVQRSSLLTVLIPGPPWMPTLRLLAASNLSLHVKMGACMDSISCPS